MFEQKLITGAKKLFSYSGASLFLFSVVSSVLAFEGDNAISPRCFSDCNSLQNIISGARGTLNSVIGILFVIATIVFLWGVIQYIAKAGDETSRNKAKGIMTWGIIGLAVMAATWGLVGILVSYFGATVQPRVIPPPTFP